MDSAGEAIDANASVRCRLIPAKDHSKHRTRLANSATRWPSHRAHRDIDPLSMKRRSCFNRTTELESRQSADREASRHLHAGMIDRWTFDPFAIVRMNRLRRASIRRWASATVTRWTAIATGSKGEIDLRAIGGIFLDKPHVIHDDSVIRWQRILVCRQRAPSALHWIARGVNALLVVKSARSGTRHAAQMAKRGER